MQKGVRAPRHFVFASAMVEKWRGGIYPTRQLREREERERTFMRTPPRWIAAILCASAVLLLLLGTTVMKAFIIVFSILACIMLFLASWILFRHQNRSFFHPSLLFFLLGFSLLMIVIGAIAYFVFGGK